MDEVGRFIVLEGGDGVGKTTQIALLSSWLDAVGLAHISTREPGGTPVGEAIREVVLGGTDLDMPAESELLLILAARAAFVRDVVRPALAAGTTVLADRFSLSTLAYQGYGRGIDLDRVRAGIEISTGGLVPDLCLVLDLPVDEGRERQRREGVDADRIEREGTGFRDAVRDGYLALADSEPGVEVLSAKGTPEEVHARIRDRLVASFPTTFPLVGVANKSKGGKGRGRAVEDDGR
jgi:dTMP kinase